MRPRTSVLDLSGNYEESIQRWARDLGTNKIRRRLFNLIYGRGSKPKSKKQLMIAAGVHQRDEQQVQNELEYLVGKHLIQRMENDGSVDDRSRYLYLKDEHVRVNRPKIIKLADNRKLADALPTKRNSVTRILPTRSAVTRQALKKRKKLGVLYLTANPRRNAPLRVDAEIRQVQEAVRGSKFRDNIELRYSPAADLNSIINGLNDHSPRVVHFSGHGFSRGIELDDGKIARPKSKPLKFDILARALSSTDSPPQVVVLNSCYSSGARSTILAVTQILIVMRDTISDVCAVSFATKFYAAIASGQSVKSAFLQGKMAVEIVSLREADAPALFSAKGIDPAKLILT